MNFQKSVLIIALIILVIILGLIGYGISQTTKNITWPDQQYQCPDYFPYLSNIDVSGTMMSGCFNKNNLGNGSNTIQGLNCTPCSSGVTDCFACSDGNDNLLFDVSYNDATGWNFNVNSSEAVPAIQNLFTDFSANASYCEKYTWATSNNISWDSITYGTKNPGYDSNGNQCT